LNAQYNYSDAQRRELANLQQIYPVWRGAKQLSIKLNYRLRWERRGEREYLYKRVGKEGNGTSLGPRNPETEALFENFIVGKRDCQRGMEDAQAALAENLAICGALGLAQLPSQAAHILRAADLYGLLGSRYLVVGTNAMLAYELEAGNRFAFGLDATKDFDLAFTGGKTSFLASRPVEPAITLFDVLQQIDATYTINTERSFQAINSKTYEVELLAAPSVRGELPAEERLSPLTDLFEQEWLLLGAPVFQVVCATDKSPAPIVAPDPRWMALHKLWLAEKPTRKALKKEKDKKQGLALLTCVRDYMPHYPMDDAFLAALPHELRPHYDEWLSDAPPKPAAWHD